MTGLVNCYSEKQLQLDVHYCYTQSLPRDSPVRAPGLKEQAR